MKYNEILAILMFVSFIGLLFTGYPVAWVLGGLAIFFTAIAWGSDLLFGTFTGVDWAFTSGVVDRIWDVMKNWVLVSLPMFIYMGIMLDRSGIAEQMMDNFVKLFGRMKGGMAIVVAIIGILLAASTGIVGASVTLLALLGLPAMLNLKYDKGLASGTVAAVGTLGILIPPSIMLVLMADRLSLSAGDLFMGALIPGLLLGVLYMAYILFAAYTKPDSAPAPADPEPLTSAVIWGVVKAAVPAFALILAVLGSIFAGIATPTEASGIGALGAMLLAWMNGKLDLQVMKEASYQTTKTTAFIFGIFLGATAYSLVLRGMGGDEVIEAGLKALPFGADGVVIAVLFFAFILGFFLDWIEITLIILPLIAPVIKSFGFDLVWFTVLFAVVLQSSFLTPPVGFSLFYLKGVAPEGVTTRDIYRGIIPFNVMIFATVVLVYVWKDLVLWLPSVAYK
ncbi:MAG: TRAP transporter large permease subunit [Betaproteobacteria bacterium]|nr:TRAP transporter large permease subunit [Betaproteobacteria bacterium]